MDADQFLPSEGVEPLADRRIRQAMEAGEFDDLPGQGKPIPGAGVPDDDLWWIRGWMERNGIDPVRIAPLGKSNRPKLG